MSPGYDRPLEVRVQRGQLAAGIKGQEEQERRATSSLLAVIRAVPEFGHALLRECRNESCGRPALPLAHSIVGRHSLLSAADRSELVNPAVRPDPVPQIARPRLLPVARPPNLVVASGNIGVGDVGLATEALRLGYRVGAVLLHRVACPSRRVEVLLLELVRLSPVELGRSRVSTARTIGAAST